MEVPFPEPPIGDDVDDEADGVELISSGDGRSADAVPLPFALPQGTFGSR